MIPNTARCPDSEVMGRSGNALTGIAQEWAYLNNVPLNASIEITLKCNISCLHCYNFDRDTKGPANRVPAAGDAHATGLSDEEILSLMTDLRTAGCLFLSLTGGEVFTHPGLFRFLDHAQTLNLAVQLLTNGTLLRPGVAGRLAKYPNLLGVSVSLYGATAATHDGVTQSAGSFDRTWAGVERLRALGVAVRLKFVLMRQNVHEADAMLASAADKNFPYMVDLNVTARHDGTDGSLITRIGRADLESLYRGPLNDMLPKGRRTFKAEQFPCNCARANCAISANGDVLPCISVPMPAGNIRQQPFAKIWESSPVFQRIRGLVVEDYPQCSPCAHKAYCGRPRGAAYTASGSYTGIDPFVCASAEIVHQLANEDLQAPKSTG